MKIKRIYSLYYTILLLLIIFKCVSGENNDSAKESPRNIDIIFSQRFHQKINLK